MVCGMTTAQTIVHEQIWPPIPGQRVVYVSKMSDGVTSPATVTRTKASTVSDGMKEWAELPVGQRAVVTSKDGSATHETGPRPEGLVAELPDETTVDLYVMGLGASYREFAVPYDASGAPGTWHLW